MLLRGLTALMVPPALPNQAVSETPGAEFQLELPDPPWFTLSTGRWYRHLIKQNLSSHKIAATPAQIDNITEEVRTQYHYEPADEQHAAAILITLTLGVVSFAGGLPLLNIFIPEWAPEISAEGILRFWIAPPYFIHAYLFMVYRSIMTKAMNNNFNCQDERPIIPINVNDESGWTVENGES